MELSLGHPLPRMVLVALVQRFLQFVIGPCGNWPLIKTFSSKRIISDGERTVEIYNVGFRPHVEEMTIVYLA